MNTRRGLTLVEVVVIAFIILFGLALLLPTIQINKTAAVRNVCMNNLRNIALGMLNFESAKRQFPGYLNTISPDSPNAKSVGYQVPLFPYIERNDLWRVYADDSITPEVASASPNNVYLPILICPSNPPPSKDLGSTYNAYVVNGGSAAVDGTKHENMADGICFDQSVGSTSPVVTLQYVVNHDGAEYTLLLSENLQAWRWQLADNLGNPIQESPPTAAARDDALFHHIFVWIDTNTPSDRNLINGDINNRANPIPTPSTDIQSSRPSSQHVGGVNTMFVAGNARFIAEDIDYNVYKQLMTPNGKDATGTGRTGSPGGPKQLGENEF
jgi:type II secretory pathway pseudopilin PulG